MRKHLAHQLAARRQEHLYRQRRVLDSAQGVEPQVDGRKLLSFCSNDYLGLARHPQLARAMQQAAHEYGTGAGAAHLLGGHMRVHHELEEALAEFTGYSRALLFSTGYMANLGVISTFAGAGDCIFEDRLNHASLLDAALLSRARLQRYAHGDASDLQDRLMARKQGQSMIATDGVFSMDGDIAPLGELARIAREYNIPLLVDDAHGIGVLGEQGRGAMELCELKAADIPLLMGTLGKGFGSFGAFVAGDELFVETLIQQARPYIYTTALPPAVAAASLASLQIIQGAEGHERRQQLAANIARFRHGARELGLPLPPSASAIQPLLLGSTDRAMAFSEKLLEAGILISAIRPPTVPEGTARLRITISAAHVPAQIDRLLAILEKLL